MSLNKLWNEYKQLDVVVREQFSLHDYVESYGEANDLRELDSYVNEKMFEVSNKY